LWIDLNFNQLFMTKEQLHSVGSGSVLALDLGDKLVGAAISDDRLVTIKRLAPLKRSNWKRLLREVETLVERFDAQTLVIGLPLKLDGSFGSAAEQANKLAGHFAKSLKIPVYLQDERLTSFAAREDLLSAGYNPKDIPKLIDGEAASLILRDFLQNPGARRKVET